MAELTPRYRVLVVDDEASVRTLVARILQQRYEITTAEDGPHALAVAESDGPFDLLVTDFLMPGMSGADLAAHLRRVHPAIKILYLTGYSDRLFEARASLWDDEAFLEKPFTVPGLLEAAALLLEGYVPAPRARRVRPRHAHIRAADRPAELVSLSVTGALIQTPSQLPGGTDCPLALTVEGQTVHLTGRVVSCEPRQDAPSPPMYAVALAFVRPSPDAVRALQVICDAEPPAS
jgi:CheY-like chemotaxis protein